MTSYVRVSNSDRGESILITLDQIEIPAYAFGGEIDVSNRHESYQKEHLNNELLGGAIFGEQVFYDVILGQSSQGDFRSVYVAPQMGF